MIAGFHTIALHQHDWASAAGVLGRIGYAALGVRLSRARLDPLAAAERRMDQIELLAAAADDAELGSVDWIVDADGPYVLDPWSAAIGDLMCEGPTRERRLESLAGAIAIASGIGSRLVTFASGVASPSLDPQSGMDRLAEALVRLAPIAERAGVAIALRPRPDHFVDSIGRFERLAQWIEGRAEVLLAADVGTMVAGGEMPVVDLLTRTDSLGCVYLSEVRWVAERNSADALIGGSHVSAARVVAGLAEHGFRGPTIVEPACSQVVDPAMAAALYQRIFGQVAGGPPPHDLPTHDTL